MISDFRIAARVLEKDPLHSLVSIIGLAIGLGFCLLLLGYSRYSTSYNQHVPGVDQVYVLKHKRNWELGKNWIDQMPMAVRDPAKSVSGIADISGYTTWFPLTIDTDAGLREIRGITALPGFTRLMGIEALHGDLEATLARPDAIAITEAAALRLFGSMQVLDRTVTLRLDATDANVQKARIGAILPTPPANTTIPYESLNGLELTMLPPWAKDEALTGRRGFQGGHLLVRLDAGASVTDVTAALQAQADDSPLAAQVPDAIKAHAGTDKFTEIRLSPLRGEYLANDVTPNFFSAEVPRGDARVVSGLAVVGVVLLLLAALNYVNLATIRVLRRQREISLRKVLGVRPRRLAGLFMAESLLVALVATALGLVLATLALPAFGQLVDRDLSSLLTAENLGLSLALGVVVGLLTAIYPAWVALRVRPARMLAGRDGESTQGIRLRRALSVLQLALAMGLGAFTLAISLQTRFAMNASPGFDTRGLLAVQLPIGSSAKWTEFANAFLTELQQQPAIAGVAVLNEPMGGARETWATDIQREGGDLVFMEIKAVSSNFFDVHGITPIAGKLFRTDESEEPQRDLVINALAAKILGFPTPELAVGQTVRLREFDLSMGSRVIIGIAPDVQFRSLRDPTEPVIYARLSAGATLVVKARDSMAATEQAIFELWPRHLQNAVFAARPVQDYFADDYENDARLASVLGLATLIALLIAGGGAFVLATDAVQRRTREIALRKLFGANRRHIGALVARDLGRQILFAALIALPIAALVIARYLAPFIERTPLAYAMMGAALLAAMVVVAVAASRQTWLAMRLRPAAALRS